MKLIKINKELYIDPHAVKSLYIDFYPSDKIPFELWTRAEVLNVKMSRLLGETKCGVIRECDGFDTDTAFRRTDITTKNQQP